MADLYVYFYELGIRLLKPGGLLSFIVTNKWMKAGYGEPLRRFFAEHAWMESVVDFGHAKQIFEEADVFPSIIVARRPTDAPKPQTARLCTIPREQLHIEDLSQQIEREGVALPLSQLTADAWQLEPGGVNRLLAKIKAKGVPMAEYADAKPYRGILTGYNDAFLIDTATRNALVEADPNCVDVVRPYVRGQDIDRWASDWAALWMIILKSSGDCSWPWSKAGDEAETIFRNTYPSIHARMKPMEDALRKRQDKGRYWWELRSCAYWDQFENAKIVYQEIQFHSRYALDAAGRYGNNKTFFLASADPYLLAVLNSPIIWWHNWRYLPHMKDEALSPVAFLMESLPVALPSDSVRWKAEKAVNRIAQIVRDQQTTRRQILDWLQVEYEVEKPTLKLQELFSLDCDCLVAEVKKVRGKKKPLSAIGLANLRAEYARSMDPARALMVEAVALESELSDLVNEAYGLTPEERVQSHFAAMTASIAINQKTGRKLRGCSDGSVNDRQGDEFHELKAAQKWSQIPRKRGKRAPQNGIAPRRDLPDVGNRSAADADCEASLTRIA